MADFWIDEEGKYYYIKSSTQLLREDGKMLFKITPPAPPEPAVGNPIGPGWFLYITYPA